MGCGSVKDFTLDENRCPNCGRYMRFYEGWVSEGQHEAEYICDNPKCKTVYEREKS